LVSVFNTGLIGGNAIAGSELTKFQVKAGYFERIYRPMVLNTVYSIFVILLLPVFIRHRLKRNKLDQLEDFSDQKTDTWTEATSPGLKKKRRKRTKSSGDTLNS